MNSSSFPIPHLLVVDDDARLRALLARYLGEQGWLVTCAKDAADARIKLAYLQADLIILDVMMPKETGVEFAKDFRLTQDTPILMLTAMSESNQRIDGLEAGADDYLTKPFEPRELVLRIEKLLARTMKVEHANTLIRFGEYALDSQHKRLSKAGNPVHLTESEMSLLIMLAEQLNRTVSRETLSLSITSPDEEANPRSVDVLITRLRRKIEPEPAKPIYLHTVRGEGYVLRS